MLLARIIHERFYCNRGFAAATHLAACFTAPQAGGLAARSVNILFKDASLPRGLGSGTCLAYSYKGASPLVESPRMGHTPFGTPRRGVTPPPGSARPSRPPSLTLTHSMGEGWVEDDEPS